MSAGSSTTDDDAFSLGSSADSCEDDENEKVFQLIDDSVDLLERILKKVVAKRDGARDISVDRRPEYQRDSNVETLLDEVKDFVSLSNGDRCVYKTSPAYVRLEEKVVNQLRDFVSVIAYMYPDNKFHSFEHANYATAAMHKLFSRTVIPEKMDFVGMSEEDKIASTNLLQFSHKVASDPMTQFTLVFSALIHDVQHPGVSNEQLSKENADVAILYNKRCVNEQNSLEVAWAMFLDPSYADLRACLFKTQKELNRFRHLVVNAVMATDLFDKRLKVERYNRWTKTFVPNENSASSFQFSFSSLDAKDDADLKATVVLEYMIQASDIFHTLQPVDEFLLWNEKLFHESYQAYLDGRADLEPSRGWCAAELEFFDNYVLPLASKLKECEMFGYTAEVFMRNAARNRKEWLLRGQEHVSKFIRSYRKPLVQ